MGEDGRIVASATGAKRRGPAGVLVQMPNVSASGSRVYYLDGDSKVMFLTPGGATGSATSIAVDQNSAAVFSVSPDDRRIAVAVLTFPYPARTRIYVEDLTGGGHHVELFSSSAELEWPVGWHQGHLVIAVGTNAHPQNAYEGFTYANRGYHVADADTGDRLATVCDGFDANTPPVPAGTTCVNDPSYEVSDWAGAVRSVSGDTGCGGGALSPDGSWIARCHGANPRTVVLLARDGATKSTNVQATPVGWIDASRVVVRADTPDASLMILNVQTLQLTPIQAKGFFGGSVPGGL